MLTVYHDYILSVRTGLQCAAIWAVTTTRLGQALKRAATQMVEDYTTRVRDQTYSKNSARTCDYLPLSNIFKMVTLCWHLTWSTRPWALLARLILRKIPKSTWEKASDPSSMCLSCFNNILWEPGDWIKKRRKMCGFSNISIWNSLVYTGK